MRLPRHLPSVLAAVLLQAGAAGAQQAAAPAAPASSASAASSASDRDALASACARVPAAPTAARDLADRAQCVLAGLVPSPDRFAQARDLARRSLQQGDAAGGYMLYRAFAEDPANSALRDGKLDPEAYRQLAQRPLAERAGQVEAIEALGAAAAQGHVNAATLLAGYFHDTVAPRNVARLRAITHLLLSHGEHSPDLERMAREADAIERVARKTQASARSFFEAYQAATVAAVAGYKVQTAGGRCDKPVLKSVSAGAIEGAEYLPLKGTMVAGSYLVKGRWPEYWTFDACHEEVPVKVTFEADGWGGTSFTAIHNKGD